MSELGAHSPGLGGEIGKMLVLRVQLEQLGASAVRCRRPPMR